MGHLKLALLDPRPLRLDLVDWPDLVGEVELLEGDRPIPHAQGTEVLAVAHHELGDPRQLRILHRLDEK